MTNLNQVKTCPRCHETKPVSDFYPIKSGRQSGRFSSYCKVCLNEYNKDYNENNKERIRARVVKYRYGLTLEEVDALPKECEICSSIENLHIDHDHATNTVRGILCGVCNRGIGMFRDDPTLLTNALHYVLRYNPYQI